MFPVLLDDQSLVNEFQTFIEAVDDSHELTLAGHQQYPVDLQQYTVSYLPFLTHNSCFSMIYVGSLCLTFPQN